MRNGLTFALFAVAFAAVSVSHAETPTIKSVPDVIIGNIEDGTNGATSTNNFVFPDAIDLRDLFIADDTETAETLKWSFESADADIQINGIGSLTGDPADPAAGERLDLVNLDAGSEFEPSDANPFTLTFRNLSPPAQGSGGDEEALVTLYASDCTDFAQKEFSVFTVEGVADELAGIALTEIIPPTTFNTGNGSAGWVGGDFIPSVITATTGIDSAGLTGLCIGTATVGDFGGQWRSPDDYIDVTANTVYRARMELTTDQTDTSLVPYVRLLWTNSDLAGGLFVYGGEHFTNGTTGGANAIGQIAAHDFYFSPIGSSTTQFSSALADAANAPIVDIRLELSVLDVNVNLLKDSASGTICMGSIAVDAMNIDEVLALSSTAYEGSLDSANYAAEAELGGTLAIAGGSATFDVPSAAAGAANFVSMTPNDASITPDGTRNTLKFDPVIWEANTLYIAEADAAASGAGDDPPYLFAMPFDILTVELACSSFGALGNAGIGLHLATVPNATPQAFRTFWYGHNVSADSASLGVDTTRFRNVIQVVNNGNLSPGTGDDDIIVSGFRTLKVAGVDIP